MRILISWSGERSHRLAIALRDWLPDMFHDVDVWVSSHDIEAGVNWSTRLATILADCRLGISCITPENQRAPWLMFEAGAVSKSIETGRLVPVLLGLNPSDLQFPLAQFQNVQASRLGIQALVDVINQSRTTPLASERLAKHFDRWWPDLERGIDAATAVSVSSGVKSPERSEREILGEILQRVRSIGPTAKGIIEYIGLSIDSRPLLGEEIGRIDHLSVPEDMSVQALLDAVWGILSEQADVPPYKYGELWVLRNPRTGRMYLEEEGSPAGFSSPHLPISTVEILDRDRLEVVPGLNSRPEKVAPSAPSPPPSTELQTFGFRPAQLRILSLLSAGQAHKQIARELQLSEPTVKAYVSEIYRTLGISSRSELMEFLRNTGQL